MTQTPKTKPKHPKTLTYLKQGIFSDLKSFKELEKRIAKLKTDKEKGDAFEVFAEAYLATQKISQADVVYPFDKIPTSIAKKLALDTEKDMGVDGLLVDRTRQNHAYQVKFRTNRPQLPWRELSTFVGLADRTDKKLIFTNCNAVAPVVEKRKDVYFIRGYDLDKLTPEDFQTILAWLRGRIPKHVAKKPQPHQKKAITAITEAFQKKKRATTVLACGSGKTLIALWTAEKMGAKKVLVLLPSLALVSQTLQEWMVEGKWENFSYLCVCSDPSVDKSQDAWTVRQTDVNFPIGTDPEVVDRFLSAKTGGVKVVFSTYQSAKIVAQGMNGRKFDLGIFDEAHKTAGREGARFAFALKDENLPIRKRLFMTATPKHYNILAKDKEGESKLVYSMDDDQTYGERAYTLSFRDAVNQSIICDYKVLISVVTSDEVNAELLKHGEVTVDGEVINAQWLAHQLALKRAVEKYKTKKIFTFHTYVKQAREFATEERYGIDEMLPQHKPFHVNGEMPVAVREKYMGEFREARKAVMSNARCLTEGVDVPTVDMVAFITPKKSRIDIVQATGRAMRKSDGKKVGYILIPLFVEQGKGEDVEDAVARASFREVWDVLQAMSEQDEELVEIIAQLQEERGKTGLLKTREGFDKKVEVLGYDVQLDRLRKAIAVRCVKRLGKNWDYMYGQLVAYKEEHGDCLVKLHKNTENPSLANWVNSQRTLYNKGELEQYKTELLESIGFIWAVDEYSWEENFKLLTKYKADYGDCLVPHNYENKALFVWVAGQRQAYKNNKLSGGQIKKLEDLGFVWKPFNIRWEKQFNALALFRKTYGHCNVSRGYENKELARWVLKQRQAHKEGRLAEDKVKRLEKLGFIWIPHNTNWEKQFNALALFQKTYGHCKVSRGYENKELARWVLKQRQAHKEGRLAEDKVKRLEKLGFIWDFSSELDVGWELWFIELTKYKIAYGHCSVSSRDKKHKRLADWSSRQREQYKKGNLSKNRIELLTTLGFVWNPVKEREEERFLELLEFKKMNGHCNVPANFRNTKLANWVNVQRSWHKQGKLPKDREQRLRDIGFEFSLRRKRMEND